MSDLKYNAGFGNAFITEAIPNTIPEHNNPQRCPHGLYSEQLSGTAFTAPRAKNQKSWLFRIRPSVLHEKFVPVSYPAIENADSLVLDPNQFRWSPFDFPHSHHVDFLSGLQLVCGSGESTSKSGLNIYVYTATSSMIKKAFNNSDGDFLIVPQEGRLTITTEFGKIYAEPSEIVVIQRGIRYSVAVEGHSRGYVLEVFNGHFILPDLGPIGANGLANPNDFLTPVAWFEDTHYSDYSYKLVNKFGGKFFEASMDHSPFDVVGWHGNYAPYKYDLRKFCCMNTVTYDHPDPSIYTVLTCPTLEPGVATCDFVIFPNRWMVGEDTFRPPYFHRNIMSEFMGLIDGSYDAKSAGFLPGGFSLHSPMTPHGPDTGIFEKHSEVKKQVPEYFDGGLAFMFETTYILKVAPSALVHPTLQLDYTDCWKGLKSNFVIDEKEEHERKRAKK